MLKSQNLSNTKTKIMASSLFSEPQNKKSSSGRTPSIVSSIISSNHARYLSHISFYQEESEVEDNIILFWNLTEKCLLYLKREQEKLNTDLHDELLGHVFSHSFDLGKIDPTPLNNLGQMLITNGYFLGAYAIYKKRQRGSDFILKYYEQLFRGYNVTIGKRQMIFYLRGTDKECFELEQNDQHSQCVVRKNITLQTGKIKSS